jgi:branched-chain amino acid transport system substrate-binding protein
MAAVRDYIAANRVPTLVAFPLDPSLAQPPLGRSLFRVAGTHQTHGAAGQYAAAALGLKRAVLVASDYPPGFAAAAQFRGAFETGGGRVTAEVYVPLGALDMTPYLAQLRAAAPDADLVAVPHLIGRAAPLLVQAYAEAGLDRRAPMLVPSAANVESATPPAPPPIVGAAWLYSEWAPSIAAVENRAFVEAFRKRYAKDPNPHNVHGYVAGQAALQALAAAGGKTADNQALIDALERVSFMSPRGPFRFDSRHQAVSTVYFRKVDAALGSAASPVTATVEDAGRFAQPSR